MIEHFTSILKKRIFRRILILVGVFSVTIICMKLKVLSNSFPYKRINNLLLNLEDFHYKIQNEICYGDIYLLILIHSAPNHFHHRNLIRKTWGHPDAKFDSVKVVFLLAASPDLQIDIEKENKLHRDIIQGNFLDSYRNLTYKHTMGLKWASENCAQAKFLMKMDDDIFVDIFQFMHYIKEHFTVSKFGRSIVCFLQSGMPVVRDPVSKWYVSKAEYPHNVFENYCSGWAYLTTPEVAYFLVQAAKQLNYFWVDDVHITGSAAKTANISHIKMNELFDLESDGLIDWCTNPTNLKWNKTFAPTWGDLVLSKKAYRKTLQCYVTGCKCCYIRKATPRPTQPSTTRKGVAKLLLISR